MEDKEKSALGSGLTEGPSALMVFAKKLATISVCAFILMGAMGYLEYARQGESANIGETVATVAKGVAGFIATLVNLFVQ